jgi:hypothetical protein
VTSVPDLRAEIVAWLRSFHSEIAGDSVGALLDEILAEFASSTGLFPPREAFFRELEALHQTPKPNWSRRVQTWYPNHRYLDWCENVSADSAL